ncbi:transposase family protein [Novosphingobium sp. 18050]|uniref:transposase family protein n=1 Tax=unclassified Novosphingobium TaxID=2644732 RepID=UPI0034CFE055
MSGRLATAEAICPDCATLSTSFHSRYDRTLSDLPISGSMVRLRLSVRRCVGSAAPTSLFSGACSTSHWCRQLAVDMGTG